MKCPSCGIENLDDSKFCRKCATPLPGGGASFTRTIVQGSAELASGTVIAGHYKIDKILGRGGMGVVYLADDTRLKRPVALKFLPPGLALDEDIRRRFMIEAQAAAALSHPNICTIHEVDDQAERAFISMEYVEGESLREKVTKGPLPFDQVLDIALQVCAGLGEAHKKGIVHRDIKSANIMLTANGQAKVMDFGLAKVVGTALVTKEGSTMGTVAYMSPEQAKGEAVDARTDIWSLGVVLYELASGKLPFRGDLESAIIHNIIHEEPQSLKAIVPKAPEEFERIIRRALRKKVEDRYGSAAETLADLRKLHAALEKEKAGVFNLRSFLRIIRKPLVAVPSALVLIALGFLIYSTLNHQAKVRWANEVLIPKIMQNADSENYSEAFRLAIQAKEVLGDAPALAKLWPSFSILVSLITEPQQARVYRKPYASPDAAWELVGLSALTDVRFSRDAYRLKIEKDGYQTVDDMRVFRFGGTRFPEKTEISYRLDRPETVPEGMVHVFQQKTREVPTLDSQVGSDLSDYWIDRFEVTNEDYKRFVDSGGYNRAELWKIRFLRNGKAVTWPEAMKIFRDQTGRPGPASWESGTFPEGQGRYPVRGVSWYEAAAYAEFAGKSLPTIQHWSRAAGLYCSNYIIPLSNFGHGGPAAVGTYRGMGPFGVYDMAGNVKEWCWNEAEQGLRYILGGGWDEPSYMFNDIDAQVPWVRSGGIGFRCVKYSPTDTSLEQARSPVPRVLRDYSKENPTSDKAFEAYKGFYSYDKLPLNPSEIRLDLSSELWVKETVSFSAAYDNERVMAYLFLPKHGRPPFQVVIYFPGSNALLLRSSNGIEVPRFDFVVKSGRALMYPIYKSTYERGDGLTDDVPNTSILYRDHVLMWAKDVSRSIDYLETRADIDTQHLAYLGFSWGGVLGTIIPAVEKRIKVNVLVAGGLDARSRARPEVDGVNFLPRITQPTLMLNGAYDYYFPEKPAQEPMFHLLGTPPALKQRLTFEAGHSVPRVDVIREVLAWLDRYQGPVK
jgi:serine/threonine protein kinase